MKGLIFKTPTLYFIRSAKRRNIFNALKEGLRKSEHNIADLNLPFLLDFDWSICQTKIYKYEKMPRNNQKIYLSIFNIEE